MASELTDAEVDALIKKLQGGDIDKAQVRSFFQGLTFGFSDEIEAGARSIFSETYDEAVGEIRGKLSDYQEAFPIESAAYEVGGAIVPAIAATVLTGGAAAPAVGGSLVRTGGRLALIGGAEGAATALGTSEGGVSDRIKNVPLGFAGGAAFGPIGAASGKVLGMASNKVLDFARRTSGKRGATVVEQELLRMANDTGLTTDEIVGRIAAGETMSDNRTLHINVRALMAQGGLPEKQIRETLPARAKRKRLEALSGVKSGLSTTTDENVLRATRMNEADWKQAQTDGYKEVFDQADDVSQNLSDVTLGAVQQLPDAMTDINKIYTAKKLVPLFKQLDNGSIEYARLPTLEDSEIIRRTIFEAKGKAYRDGSGGLGEALGDVESALRKSIDNFSPELGSVRAGYKKMMGARTQFEEGRKAFNSPPEQLEITFNKLLESGNDVDIQAFREGVMAKINDKMSRNGRKAFLGKMSDPESLEGKLFTSVFPPEQQAKVLRQLELSGTTQATSEVVIGGPTTALTNAALKQQNKGISVGEMVGATLTPNVRDIAAVGVKLIQDLAPNLTEAQRGKIVDVLLSDNPELVRKALTDESAMMAVQKKVAQIMQGVQASAQRGAAYYGGTQGEKATQSLLSN
tara:strand:+ start:2008 stop:3903 length:1896 start_codon:yes stop_codon:yes gene_type:complete